MSFAERILKRMFGRPKGLLRRLGGIILARTNRAFAQEIVALLNIRASEGSWRSGSGLGSASSFS
jgi:hypothetical protein